MARKSPDSGASTATADKPERKTRTRKTPKDKAKSLTVRVMNAIRKLACIELSVPQRDAVNDALSKEIIGMKQSWDAQDDANGPPDEFEMPD